MRQVTKIIITFLTLIELCLTIDNYCQTPSPNGNSCSLCNTGFTLNQTTGLCVSNCPSNVYYEPSSSTCVASCSYNEIGNSSQNVCEQIYQCPLLADVGQDFHKGSAVSIIIDNRNTDQSQNILVSISDSDTTIKLWNLKTGQLKSTFSGHTQPILKIFLLQSSNLLLSFSSNGEIFQWNYLTGQLVAQQTVTLGQLTTFSSVDLTQNVITLYGFQGEFFIYNYQTLVSQKYIGHTNIVLGAILLDIDTVITYSLDKSIYLWSITSAAYTFDILCEHQSTPGGIALLNFSIATVQYKYLLSFGTTGQDSLSISISNLQSKSTYQCVNYLSGDFTQPIINIIVDNASFSVIAFSTVEINVYGYNQSSNQFILLQKLNQNFFTTISFLPLAGLYINQSVIVIFTAYGQIVVTNYLNQNQSLQSNQNQVIIQTTGLNPLILSRKDIRGIFIDSVNGMLYFFGQQIQQINLVTHKLNYIINNLITPFIVSTQSVPRIVSNPSKNIMATTSFDGHSITYDLTKGEMISLFLHPNYITSQTQPQGQQVCLIQGLILCIAYSDQSVVCYDAVNTRVYYNSIFTQPVLNLFNDDTNGYLLINSLDYLQIVNPLTQQVVNTKYMVGQFYFMNFYENFNCMTTSINGYIIRWYYPQLTIEYQADTSSINTSTANIVGFAFETAQDGYSIFYFFNGLTILFDQQLNVIQNANDNVQINRCGIVKQGPYYVYYICLNQNGSVIGHGIGANKAFYFQQQVLSFPITTADVIPEYNKAMFVIDLGSYGGSVVFADASTLLGQSQFNSAYPITRYMFDSINQRVYIPNTSGQVMVSHFVPYTNSIITRNENTPLQQLLLIQSQQKLVILSNVITIYDYFTMSIFLQNTSVFKQAIKNALIVEDLSIIIAYNSDTSNNLQIWNYLTGQIQALDGHSYGVNGIQFIESAGLILSYDSGGLIKVWSYNSDLSQIQSYLNIKQHNTNSITTLQIFNSYTTLFISFDVAGNVFITNYMNGSIIKAFQVQQMNSLIVDYVNNRIFLYGNNIAVFSAITGAKLADLIGFDNTVQNVILKNNYIVAYGSVSIQSFQRDTLTLLYSSKFKNTIYSLAILINLVGMVGNNVDNTIELWDYTNGVMLSNIVNGVYNQNLISIIADEESELFIIQNVGRQVFTVTPFGTSYTQIKDFLLVPMTSSIIKTFVIDFVSNKLIVCNNDMIVVWNYFAFLGVYGQAYLLPSNSQIMAQYQQQSDIIAYADLERNVWFIQNNLLSYQTQLTYNPTQLSLHTNTFLTIDGTYLYSYDINFNQISQLKIYPYKIYLDQSILFIFVQTYSYSIIQLMIDDNSSVLTLVKMYSNHSNRIVKCIINTQQNHIITYDVTGLLAINNYNTQQQITISQQHTQIIRNIIIDYKNSRLLSCSADTTIIMFSYNGDNPLTVLQVFSYSTSVVSGLIDSQRSQVLIWSDLQQVIEVRDLTSSSLALVKKIYGPGDYMIQIKLSTQFNILAIFNPFQVNLHDRMNNDKMINSLRQPSTLYDIQDVKFLSQSILLIVSLTQLDLVRFSTSSISIETTFSMYYPTILTLSYTNQLMLNFKGVNLKTAFNYTIPYANDPTKATYTQCYSNLQRTSSYFQVSQDLSLQSNSFVKIQQTISSIVLNIQQDDSQNFFFVQLNNFAGSNNVKQYYVYDKKQGSSANNIKLSFTSFQSFDMSTLSIKNFIWEVIDSQIYYFNANTQNIMFTNSIFVNDITATQFVMNSINSLLIDSISISNLNMKLPATSGRRLQSSTNEATILFKVTNSAYVYINDITLSNLLIDNSYTLFEFINVQTVIINNLVIDNVNYFIQNGEQDSWTALFSIQSCQNVQISKITINNCNTALLPSSVTYSQFIVFQMQANKQLTFTTLNASNNFSLKILDISQIYLQEDNGYFQVIKDKVTLNGLIIQSSNSVSGNALNSVISDNLQVNNSNFLDLTCQNSFGCALDIQSTFFTITNCEFMKLQSQYGGAISIRSSPKSSLITQSKFVQNTGIQGGAIYLDSSNLQITQTTISQNSASVGGAIRYLQLIPDFIIKKQLSLQNLFGNTISSNKATVFGQNVGSYPRNLQIQNTDSGSVFKQITNANQVMTYELDTFMSGDSVTFGVQLFDEEGGVVNLQKLNQLDQSLKTELDQYTLECISTNQLIQITGNKAIYNNTSIAFSFTEILIIAQPSTSQPFFIQNNFLQIPNPGQPTQFLNIPNYIQINVNFRACLIGEIFIKSTSSTPAYCEKCPFQKYSLTLPDPNSKDQQVCSLCPSESDYCQGSVIVLKNGYWRSNNYTDDIVSCTNNPSNCVGESSNSINNCKTGYIGPLCEECDLFGSTWNQKYMNAGLYNCIPCQQSSSLVGMYISAVLIGCLYFIFGIRSAIIMTRIKVQSYYLRMMGLASIGRSDSTDQSDVYLKFLMHFVQISTIVYQIDLPSFLFIFQVSIGTPIDSLKYSQDCKSIFAAHYIPPVYGRIIWSQIIPLGYMLFLLMMYYTLHFLKYFKVIDKKLIITGAIFMFLFLQPNIISGLVSIISCRSIAGTAYITADITRECGTEDYYKYNAILFLPLFLIWAVIVPIFWIICLYRRRHKLNYCTVRLAYGFLYQEYKYSQYYWEFVKITLKLIIIFVSTFYSQQISIKSTLCTLVLFGYLMISLFSAPYTNITFNRTDQYMCIVLIACLQINIFVNISDNYVLQSLGTIVLFIINYTFMAYLIYSVIIGKIKRYLMIFGKKFPILRNKLSFLYVKLGISSHNKMVTFRNWQTAIKLIGIHLMQNKNSKSELSPAKTKADRTERKSFFQIQTYRELAKTNSNFYKNQPSSKLNSPSQYKFPIGDNEKKKEESFITLVKSEQESINPISPDIIKKYKYMDDSDSIISGLSSRRKPSRGDLEQMYQFQTHSNRKNEN